MKALEHLLERHASSTLPHALLLIHEDEQMDSTAFANAFSQYLLCQQGSACGVCHPCRLFLAKTHPDFYWIAPSEHGQIKVEPIRDMLASLSQTAQQGAYRVIVIDEADSLNVAAANSLLKSLEEPQAKTVFLLMTARPALLLPTIKSRCQSINWIPDPRFTRFSEKTEENTIYENFLLYFQGKRSSQEVVKTCSSTPLTKVFFALQRLILDIASQKLGKLGKLDVDVLESITMFELVNYLDVVMQLQRQIDASLNLNAVLVFESLLFRWPGRSV